MPLWSLGAPLILPVVLVPPGPMCPSVRGMISPALCDWEMGEGSKHYESSCVILSATIIPGPTHSDTQAVLTSMWPWWKGCSLSSPLEHNPPLAFHNPSIPVSLFPQPSLLPLSLPGNSGTPASAVAPHSSRLLRATSQRIWPHPLGYFPEYQVLCPEMHP